MSLPGKENVRSIFFLALVFGVTGSALAQACGYTFLTVYLTDSNERQISNASVKTFVSDFGKEDRLHYPRDEDWPDRLSKKIAWSDTKQAYFGGEGLCGGHRNVGVRIDAPGLERFEMIVDLPLGWTSYAIKLRQPDSPTSVTATKLSHVIGYLEANNATRIPGAEITVSGKNAHDIRTNSNDRGHFEFDVPIGDYVVTISKNGFERLRVVNLNILEPEGEFLDLILEKGNGDKRILDYQSIKKKKGN